MKTREQNICFRIFMNNMRYAPIIIFAFNRLDSLKNSIASLLYNLESADSDLFVFVDGAREQKDGEKEKVRAVQEYVKSISGFKSLNYTFSPENKGLGASIIAGVTEVISKYGRAIVLEDDLLVQPNFLAFINQGLEKYQYEGKIFSICGYTNKISVPCTYFEDAYVCTRSSSWGWATWADRWNSVDWVLEPFAQYESQKSAFNKWGGSDCFGMLKGWHEGRNKSWAIRFCFSQFLQDKLSVFPVKSLVSNDGFDGSGTNCKKWSRFEFELEKSGKKNFEWPNSMKMNKRIAKRALSYNSLTIRAFSKIMYMIYG